MYEYKDAMLDQLAVQADETIRLRTALRWWEKEAHRQGHKLALTEACSDHWQQLATMTLWQRIKRWFA